MSMVQSEASVSAPTGDLALVKQLLAGDEAAFTGVVDRYHGPLLRFARLFVSDEAVAEEVVQAPTTWRADNPSWSACVSSCTWGCAGTAVPICDR